MKKMIGPTVVIILCGALLYWSVPRIIHVLIGHPSIIVHCDPAFAPSVQQRIESSCTKQFNPLNSVWIHTIHEQFPLTGRITSSRDNNVVSIYIEMAPLRARINNQCVIDKNGTMHTLKTITPETSAALKNITAHVKLHEINEEFKQFIQTLPAEILEKYSIEWHAPYLIVLTPTPATYRCITRYDCITDTQKLNTAECLAHLSPYSKKFVTLDLRFNKQIVLNTNNAR